MVQVQQHNYVLMMKFGLNIVAPMVVARGSRWRDVAVVKETDGEAPQWLEEAEAKSAGDRKERRRLRNGGKAKKCAPRKRR